MSRIIYNHESVERFIPGTIGMPGERQFFIQVSSLDGVHAVSLEKGQVAALSERSRELIRELRRSGLASLDELSLPSIRDNAPLDFPLSEEFRVGVMGITWESDIQRAVIEIQEIGDETIMDLLSEEESLQIEDAPSLIRVKLRLYQLRGFCDRADALMSSGRQPCPFCGLPIDVEGHLCPRANGYRR